MKYVRALVAIFLLVCLDQYTKYMVVQRLDMYSYKPILGDIFGLYYLENRGMAWGLFQNKQILFLISAVIVLVVLAVCYVALAKDSKYMPITICIEFLMAGAIGNMIDRTFRGDTLFQGAVVDFFYIKLIDFPVFNVADVFVTFSVAVLILLLLFKYKEEDFQNVFRLKKASKVKQMKEEESVTEAKVNENPDTIKQCEATKQTANERKSNVLDEIFMNEEEEYE